MAGRFPGAKNVAEFWENLLSGVDAVSKFETGELEHSVATAEAVARGEKFVQARGILEDAADFDAEMFGVSPAEAVLMDPQHRVFLECAWEALERGGCDPTRSSGAIGVYAGCGPNTYLLYNLNGASGMAERLATNLQTGEYAAMFGNNADFLATRVAFKLGLRGPAITVQTACSTSLVAVAQACTALQTYQCDAALAGGVSITFPQKRDYRYEPEAMVSPDGTCRAFDADAAGTVFSHGAGVVFLKRLEDARADGDQVLAVIRGWGVNNDGSDKLGYAAPGVTGQADAIVMAHELAEIEPASISYVEAHGTGTPLGDPVEVAALTRAFRSGGATENGFCALGTGKTHIGHLDVASGVVGLIKTVLQLQHGVIPGLLHFRAPNPRIDFENSPFVPVAATQSWDRGEQPRRAGVSSFGVGGTNAHIVLEEPAEDEISRGHGEMRSLPLCFSAKTREALERHVAEIEQFLETADLDRVHVAFTLACGRRAYEHRRVVMPCGSEPPEIAHRWEAGEAVDWPEFFAAEKPRKVELPPRPLERRRFWIPARRKAVAPPAAPTAAPVAARDVPTMLAEMITELSGLPVRDRSATFQDIGLDSLFLAQVSVAVFRRTGVQVTFRQLVGELSSVEKLAAYVERERPADAPPVAASEPMATGARLPVVRWPGGGEARAGRERKYGPAKDNSRAEITDKQREAVARLIDRVIAKTAASKESAAKNRPHFADPRAASGFNRLWKEMVYPIVSTGSRGSHLQDVDGNDYVDITMGFGAYYFGHSPDWLREAVHRQLDQGIEIGPQSAVAGELAKDFCALTAMERATFCNTGSEAVMAALRVARTVTGRDRVVWFTGGYHGMFDEVLVRGAWVDGVYRAQPIAPGIPDLLVENMLVLEYGTPESLEIVRQHAGELAAVLVEPVQSRRPDLQPAEFLHSLRDITERSGTALIFDEVVTGFRCHPGGAQAYFGISADLATYGKVIGGGIPIGVLAGKARFLDALDGGAWSYGDDSFPEAAVTFFAGTFVRHPLAMAAARAVIDRLREEGPGLQVRMNERMDVFCRTVQAGCEAMGAPVRLPHFSAFGMIEVGGDPKFSSLLWYYLRANGVHAWEQRPIFLTTAHTDADLEWTAAAFLRSVAEMQADGLLPGHGGIPALGDFSSWNTSPVTESQREVLSATRMSDDANRAFNESVTLKFEGQVDVGALAEAVEYVGLRHAALRSRFSEDREIQIYDGTVTMRTLNLGLAAAREMAATRVFDLSSAPLSSFEWLAEENALVFTAHHVVCDGWSIGMIVDELSRSYNAFRAGDVPRLREPYAFGDHARAMAAAGMDEANRDFWVEAFSGSIPNPVELPGDHPRPPLKTYAGAMESHAISDEVWRHVRESAGQLGGTVFSTLLAGYAILLRRLSGQEDLVIGVPAAGQTLAGRDELIGHCLNFLPLRIDGSGDPPVADFVGAVNSLVIDAYEHQGYTFGSLIRELQVPRDASRLPLVSVMFNIDRSGFENLEFDGLKFHVETNAKQFVNFDLFFNLVQSGSGLVVECEYNTDLFDRSTIQRWLESYETLLGSLAVGTRSSELAIMDETRRRMIVQEWNSTNRDFPSDIGVHQILNFERAEKVAVRCGDEALTYGELDARSNSLANALASAGLGPGALAGIHLERSVDLVAGLLAIWKIGAAYVPLDPNFPAARLAMMIEDAKLPVILTSEGLVERLPEHAARVVTTESAKPAGFAAAAVAGEDVAYVIFTSGSTGRPKGVRVPHRALANFLTSMAVEPGLTADDVLLSVTTLSFDIAGLEIFLPLLVGAELVLFPGAAVDGSELQKELARSGATVMQATPSTWRLLLEAGWSGSSSLKILIGGEAVPADLADTLRPLCREVWNMYGPTETTIWSTCGQLLGGPVLIGAPIANTRVYVVDDAMNPQPIGVAGELLIGGDGLALGYLDREELTAEKFVPDPFRSGERVYRTGDLARWRVDGTLECLGRIDEQVKVRGYRIELGEIEIRLARHPAVREAAAGVRADASGHPRLLAWVVPESTENGLTTTLREVLVEELPEYMVPSRFVFLDAMPLTPNGKIDRKALDDADGGSTTEREFIPPVGPTETTLAEIWQDVLEVSQVGRHDDLFELGADSILIFRIATQAKQAGLDLPVAEIFRRRTVAALAAVATPATPASVAPSIARVDRSAYRRKR